MMDEENMVHGGEETQIPAILWFIGGIVAALFIVSVIWILNT